MQAKEGEIHITGDTLARPDQRCGYTDIQRLHTIGLLPFRTHFHPAGLPLTVTEVAGFNPFHGGVYS